MDLKFALDRVEPPAPLEVDVRGDGFELHVHEPLRETALAADSPARIWLVLLALVVSASVGAGGALVSFGLPRKSRERPESAPASEVAELPAPPPPARPRPRRRVRKMLVAVGIAACVSIGAAVGVLAYVVPRLQDSDEGSPDEPDSHGGSQPPGGEDGEPPQGRSNDGDGNMPDPPALRPRPVRSGDEMHGEVLEPEITTASPRDRRERRRTTYVYDTDRRRRVPGWLPTALAASVAVAAAGGGYVVLHPHIGEFGVPNMVLEGSAVDVPYRTSGLGALHYDVVASDGTPAGSGSLPAREGTLHVAIPVVHHNEAYRIRMTLSGPLGDAANEATIQSLAVPTTRVVTRSVAPPQIVSFAVDRPQNGTSVVAYYNVHAQNGTVRLVDSRGLQFGSSPTDATGKATFAIPDSADPSTLAVELRVMKNGMSAVSTLALPSPDGSAVAVAPNLREASSDAPPFVVPRRVAGAAPIRVHILHHYDSLQISLVDAAAHNLKNVDVPSDSDEIALAHPSVSVPTQVTVEATYRFHDEVDTVVRPVLLSP